MSRAPRIPANPFATMAEQLAAAAPPQVGQGPARARRAKKTGKKAPTKRGAADQARVPSAKEKLNRIEAAGLWASEVLAQALIATRVIPLEIPPIAPYIELCRSHGATGASSHPFKLEVQAYAHLLTSIRGEDQPLPALKSLHLTSWLQQVAQKRLDQAFAYDLSRDQDRLRLSVALFRTLSEQLKVECSAAGTLDPDLRLNTCLESLLHKAMAEFQGFVPTQDLARDLGNCLRTGATPKHWSQQVNSWIERCTIWLNARAGVESRIVIINKDMRLDPFNKDSVKFLTLLHAALTRIKSRLSPVVDVRAELAQRGRAGVKTCVRWEEATHAIEQELLATGPGPILPADWGCDSWDHVQPRHWMLLLPQNPKRFSQRLPDACAEWFSVLYDMDAVLLKALDLAYTRRRPPLYKRKPGLADTKRFLSAELMIRERAKNIFGRALCSVYEQGSATRTALDDEWITKKFPLTTRGKGPAAKQPAQQANPPKPPKPLNWPAATRRALSQIRPRSDGAKLVAMCAFAHVVHNGVGVRPGGNRDCSALKRLALQALRSVCSTDQEREYARFFEQNLDVALQPNAEKLLAKRLEIDRLPPELSPRLLSSNRRQPGDTELLLILNEVAMDDLRIGYTMGLAVYRHMLTARWDDDTHKSIKGLSAERRKLLAVCLFARTLVNGIGLDPALRDTKDNLRTVVPVVEKVLQGVRSSADQVELATYIAAKLEGVLTGVLEGNLSEQLELAALPIQLWPSLMWTPPCAAELAFITDQFPANVPGDDGDLLRVLQLAYSMGLEVLDCLLSVLYLADDRHAKVTREFCVLVNSRSRACREACGSDWYGVVFALFRKLCEEQAIQNYARDLMVALAATGGRSSRLA